MSASTISEISSSPFPKRIFFHGPEMPDTRCIFGDRTCLERSGLSVIGNGKDRVGIEQLPKDLGRNPTLFFQMETVDFEFLGAHFNLAPLLTELKTMDDVKKEIRSRTLITHTDFFKELVEKLGPDSQATIVFESCHLSKTTLEQVKKILPRDVKLVTSSNNIDRLSVSSTSANYIVDTIFSSPEEIIKRTLIHSGDGTGLLHHGKLRLASTPTNLPRRAELTKHLQKEFKKFDLDPNLVTDELVTQYALGIISQKVVNDLLTESFVKSVRDSDIDLGAFSTNRANSPLPAIIGQKIANARHAAALLEAMRPAFEATIDAIIPYYGNTLLIQAIAENNLQLMDEALAAGANPNARSAEGITPLMMAAHLGNLEATEKLLSTPGLNLDETHEGYSALMFACDKNHLAIVTKLLQAKAKVGISAVFGYASSQADEEVAKSLIKLCLDNGFRPTNPPRFQEFISTYLAQKDAEASAKFVVDASSAEAVEATLPRSALAPVLATAPASASVAPPAPPREVLPPSAPTSASHTASAASPTEVPIAAGISAATSLLAVAHAFVASKYPAAPASPSPQAWSIDLNAPLPDLTPPVFTPEVLHQTDAERAFAQSEKLERAGRAAQVASKSPSAKPQKAQASSKGGAKGKRR